MPNTTSSRRDPFPYDATINGIGFMLVPDQDGQLVTRKSQSIDALPTTFEYGSQPPYKERTVIFERLYRGFGQKVEDRPTDRRTAFGINADTGSLNGLWMKGPRFTSETINAGQPILQMVRALHEGVDTVFAVSANKVTRRVGDGSWTDSLTAATPCQAVRFKALGAGAIDALYVANVTGNLRRYNGTAWATAAAGAGPLEDRATAIAALRDELWVGWDNKVAKSTADPFIRANWGAAITCGDQSVPITWMVTNADNLYVIKRDGSIYTIFRTGVAEELYPGLRSAHDDNNGRNAAVWLDTLWVPVRDALYKIAMDGTLAPDGLEQLLENDSEVRGRYVATAAHQAWANWELVFNTSTGHSYLLKYGAWVSDSERDDDATFIPARHGAFKKWPLKQGTCLQVVPFPSTGGGNDRLYAGFSDGTVEWCVLPRGGPNPIRDPNCQFSADDGYVYLPAHHAGFRADNKAYRGFSVGGPTLNGRAYAQVEYRTDPAGLWQPMVDASGVTVNFIVPGQRADFIPGLNIAARQIELRVVLKTSNLASAYETPVVESLAVHEQVRPAAAFERRFRVDARNFVARHDGSVDRRQAEQIRDAFIAAVSAIGTTPVVLPTGETEELNFYEYEDAQLASKAGRGRQWVVEAGAIGLRVLSQPAVTPGALTHGTLEQYTHGQLEGIL